MRSKLKQFVKRHQRATIIGVAMLALTAILIGAAFADDLQRTDVGLREHHVGPGGNVATASMMLRLYASQFDADGDGNTTVDSQRAVCQLFKEKNILRGQVNTCRLQRYTSTGWETLKSSGPANTGTKPSVRTYTAPPTPFACNSSTIYRVQAIGLGRVTSTNSLFSFNKESDHWIMVSSGGDCIPIYV